MDKVVDNANKKQISVCLCYIFDNCVKEEFTDFMPVDRITGKAIADAIISCLRAWGLSLANF